MTVRNTDRGCPPSPRLTPALNTIETMPSSELTYEVENNTLRLSKHPGGDGILIYKPAP